MPGQAGYRVRHSFPASLSLGSPNDSLIPRLAGRLPHWGALSWLFYAASEAARDNVREPVDSKVTRRKNSLGKPASRKGNTKPAVKVRGFYANTG